MKGKGYIMKELFKEVQNAAAAVHGGENFVKPNKHPLMDRLIKWRGYINQCIYELRTPLRLMTNERHTKYSHIEVGALIAME